MFWTKGRGQLIGLVFASLWLVACGAAATTPPSGTGTGSSAGADAPRSSGNANTQQIKAVATTSIIGDLVKNVGGEHVDVRVLLPPGTDPHTYSPTPSDVQAISEAAVLFENGLGLEEWLEELVNNAGGSRQTVVVSQGLTPLTGFEEEEHSEQSEHASQSASAETEHHDDEHGAGNDPHMWLDVQNVIGYVENIRDGLKQVDPAGATTYDANAASYITQLRQLDSEIVQQVAAVPEDRRKLITNHDTFGYFAQRYGFEVVGNVFENISTEQEPSAQQIAQLVQLIGEQNGPAIFTENTVNPRLAEQVGAEAGIKVVTDLYTDALGPAGSAGDTYVKMMRSNIQQIVTALK